MGKPGDDRNRGGDLMNFPDGFRTAEVFVREDAKLHTVPVTGSSRPGVPADLRGRWQRSLNLLTETLGVSAGLVMRVAEGGIKVFLRSGEPGEAYAAGALFPFGMDSYCENVIGVNRFVVMDLKGRGGMRSYCGLPIRWEDGSFFGTLCLLDRNDVPEENAVRPLLTEIRDSMEKDLELLCLRRSRPDRNEKYARAMEALLQYSPGGIFAYSAEEDEQFSFVSENMLAFLGYTKEAFARKFQNRFSLMVYAEDRERVLREIDEQIRCGPFDRCEYRIEKQDGSLAWVHDEGHIVADAAGKRWFYVVIVDITDSVLSQQREREKFRSSIQSFLAANPDAVGTIQFNLSKNLCGERHGVSQITRRMIGAKTADEFFAGVADQIPLPEQRALFLSVFDRAALLEDFAQGQTSRSMEYLRSEGGSAPIWVRTYLNLLKNPDTDDVEGVAYSMDISREKRRDEILRIITSQEYDMIALLHLDSGTVEAYFLGETLPAPIRELLPAAGATCGLDDFRAHAAEHWLHPEDRERYRQCSDPAYYRPLMDQNGHFEFVLRECFAGPDQPPMYRKFQHYYLGGRADTVLVIESDVTTLYLRQQQELDKAKAEAQRVTDIMDSITSGISVLHMSDPDHVSIAYVNRQMLRLLGFCPRDGEREDAARRLIRAYSADAFTGIHPDDLERVRRTFREHFTSDSFVIDNYRTLDSGGKYRWIKEEVRLREITPEHRVFYATYHDVSEEVRLTAQLTAQLESEKRLRMEASAANAAKSDFLSRMSHDIRTPLNGIIGMTYLARQQENPPRTEDCLAKIDTSSQFLLGLINDVLDMSRAESSRIELHPEPYSVKDFNAYLEAVIRPLCAEKNQSFLLDETAAAPGRVAMADKLRLNQIVFNLLSNAVKYTPPGGTITYRIRSRTTDGGRIAVDHEIADSGIGMSAEFQKVMFEPFTQEGREDSWERRGTGLGLSIVKKLVELMGGSISVKSRIGQGTTFFLHLEFDAAPAEAIRPAPRETAASPRGDGAFRGRRVLLCEDQPLNQEITKTLLEQEGAAVEIAENGREGLRRFTASPPHYFDAVLMDIRMPVMDGFEATRAIRALDRPDAGTVPILAMTADAFADDVQRCIEAGMNAHLSKPVDPALLTRTLSEHMAHTKEEPANG